MTHMAPMADSEGTFNNQQKSTRPCRHCGGTEVYYRVWESSCGGYEDEKYECRDCGKMWWIDGIDS